MRSKLILVAFIGCLMVLYRGLEAKKNPELYNIVLLGATGDLAKKYLWKALFNLFSEKYAKEKVVFMIYGCSRKDPDEGRRLLSEILLNVVQCPDEQCRDVKRQFVESTQYHQLKKEEHYKSLASKIAENTQTMFALNEGHYNYEEGRLIYLSIPPGAYTKTSNLVDKYLRPKVGRPWFRIVFEKPFGHDSNSAQLLANKLAKSFSEEEMYRIDHYLGKSIVKLMLPFRYMNRELLEPVLNREHVERVEVVMKEEVSCDGRINFYDDVGVVRDVMQNHLTEMALLVAMELPQNSGSISEIQKNKLAVLKSVEPLTSESTLFGQYSTYSREARVEMKNPEFVTSTPTFAAAHVNVNNQKWFGVPFILVSGKKLDGKESYIRIVFKNDVFCVDGSNSESCRGQKQIIFYIGGTDIRIPPMILVSKDLFKPVDSPKWRFEEITSDKLLFGANLTSMHRLMTENEQDAYSALVEAVFHGERHMFIDTQNLMASWDIWTPVLQQFDPNTLRIYEGPDDSYLLNFNIKGRGHIEYVEKGQSFHIDVTDSFENAERMSQIPSTFRDRPLVADDKPALVAKLAENIASAAQRAVREDGLFHIAFSGGTTPIPLFQHLAKYYTSTFPWQFTHVWLADERCVPLDHKDSNFHSLYVNLLQFVSIPYMNIHPMPVNVGDKPCEDDSGASQYESLIKRLIPSSRMNLILLGVGTDAHTASLFPENKALEVSDKLVTLTEGRPQDQIKKRMTFTFPMINQAHSVAFLVTDKAKHELVHTLSEIDTDIQKFPVTGVNPQGNITWYIDHKALLEH